MKRIAAGSKAGKNFGVAGVHGAENARVVVQCDDGSMLTDFFMIEGEVYINIWLAEKNSMRPADKLLYGGKLERLLECSGLCWDSSLEIDFKEAVDLRENNCAAGGHRAAQSSTATV